VGQAAAKSILVADGAVASQSARAARARQFPIVLDPSPAPPVLERLFPLADYVTPNPAETGHLTGITVRSSFRTDDRLLCLMRQGEMRSANSNALRHSPVRGGFSRLSSIYIEAKRDQPCAL
jgi:sugar/nucleoside kinase (ribokinase family)